MTTKVLRASSIGFPCDRHLWYFAEEYEKYEDPKSERIFAVGTALEPVAIKWLEEDGWEVSYNPGSQKAAIEQTIPVKGGEIRGHLDAIISRPEVGCILIDVKTMNDRAFANWKRQGTEGKSPQYLDQIHVYADAAITAKLAPIDRLGIVAVNKNNSDMQIEILDYSISIERMMEIRERAERIFSLTEAPEPGPRYQGWSCNYCAYRNACDMRPAKDTTPVGDGVAVTTEEDIINAMELLQEARDMEKSAKELEANAKEVIDEKVKKQGIKSVSGGSLILTLKEVSTSRFDNAGFKKVHPDLAQEFTKETKSVRYDIKDMKEAI
jgi:CRISPR/Cas system-associated exonuclease Cas4 (RecB family)